jgi:hypothetical protein
MSHALQVSFRHLLPSEKLVALAAESFQHVQRFRPEMCECCVVVEALGESRTKRVQTRVSLRAASGEVVEGSAVHADAGVALSLALAQVQTRLGLFPTPHVGRLALVRSPLPARRAG